MSPKTHNLTPATVKSETSNKTEAKPRNTKHSRRGSAYTGSRCRKTSGSESLCREVRGLPSVYGNCSPQAQESARVEPQRVQASYHLASAQWVPSSMSTWPSRDTCFRTVCKHVSWNFWQGRDQVPVGLQYLCSSCRLQSESGERDCSNQSVQLTSDVYGCR